MEPNQNSGQANAPVELPPLRTFNLWVCDLGGAEEQISVEAHTVQTTDAGGLNILEYVHLPNGQPAQKLRMAFAPNFWRKIEEVMIEPSRIIH